MPKIENAIKSEIVRLAQACASGVSGFRLPDAPAHTGKKRQQQALWQERLFPQPTQKESQAP